MLTRAAAQRQIPPEIKALGKRNRALPQGERIEVAGSLGDYQAAGTAETAWVEVEDDLYWPDEAELRCNRAVASAVCCHVDVALKLIPAGTCIARECDERQRFSFTRLLLSPGTSQSLRGIPLFDPSRRQCEWISTKAAAATGNTHPRRVARTNLACSKGGSISGSAIMSPGGMGALPGLRN